MTNTKLVTILTATALLSPLAILAIGAAISLNFAARLSKGRNDHVLGGLYFWSNFDEFNCKVGG